MQGRVVYSSGGNYKVLVDGETYDAKPLGIFRNDNIKILVGDVVDIEINQDKVGLEEINVITKLHQRKNEFIRPNISNVDYVIIVTSIVEPKLNDYYLDKLIAIFQSFDVEPILVFTKNDIKHDSSIDMVIDEYVQAGFKTLITNNQITFEQIQQANEWLDKKFSVITGQTGVGKSTFINLINETFKLKTGEISKALGRGKHTTRHAEAFEIFPNAFVVDTPGFSSLEIGDVTEEELAWNFFTFGKYANNCKYNNCKHMSEAGCNVRENITSKRVFENYEKLIEEIKNGKRN